MTSQFHFLEQEFAAIFENARKAELMALSEPRGACFYARLALEVAVKWMYRHDGTLRSPYETTLSALIHEPTFRELAGSALVAKAKIIKDLGNMAVHETKAVPPQRAMTAVRELFHVTYWFVRTYARGAKPDAAITFSADALPRTAQIDSTTLGKLRKIAESYEEAEKARDLAEKERIKGEGDRLKLDAEIKTLRAEIAKVKKAPMRRFPTGMITTKSRPGMRSSTCYSPKPAGPLMMSVTGNSPSQACRTRPARASSITCCGAMTTGRSGLSRPSAQSATRGKANARRSSMPTHSKVSSASARSSSIPTAMSTGSGMTSGMRRVRSRAF